MKDRRLSWTRRHLYRLWIIPIALIVLQTGVWVFDRTPPIVINGYKTTRSGAVTILHLDVKRDLSRRCSAEITRHFFDAAGVRFDVTGTVSFGAGTSASNEQRTPGKLLLALRIPPGAAKGVGQLETTAEYVCNPIHLLLPIQMKMTQDVEVL